MIDSLEAKGHHREVGSEESMEQSRGPMGAVGALGKDRGARRQGRLHARHHDRRPDHHGRDEQIAAL
jgi:hypothetical protein